jgi:hypothetical protein
MLTETLRHSADLLGLSAEMNPFLRMVGLCFPESGSGSDVLAAGHLDSLDASASDVLSRELARDIGCPADRISAADFAAAAAWRLALQWPELSLDPHMCIDLVFEIVQRMGRGRGGRGAELVEVEPVFVELLAELRRRGVAVREALYDLGNPKTASTLDDPAGPTLGHRLLEEPPFVVPRLWRRAESAEAVAKPLVIKTPSNVYRFGFLRALFPNARLRVLHLTRNPAAAINGLYDGWQSKWFHSHRMSEPLRVRGYTDEQPASAHWWKFDLPPGWQDYTEADLLEVCAFQWRSAHHAIISEIASGNVDHLQIRFEDLLSGPQCRVKTLQRVARWLDIPFAGGYRRAAERGVPLVMTTARPEPGRWLSRASRIRSVLNPPVLDLAQRLGYDDSSTWI